MQDKTWNYEKKISVMIATLKIEMECNKNKVLEKKKSKFLNKIFIFFLNMKQKDSENAK